MLRNGGRHVSAFQSDQGRLIRCGADDHRTLQPFFPQVLLHEIADFAASLADQRDYIDIGLGVASDHSKKGTFPNSSGREHANALAFTTGQQWIDSPNANGQWPGDALPAQRIWRVTVN